MGSADQRRGGGHDSGTAVCGVDSAAPAFETPKRPWPMNDHSRFSRRTCLQTLASLSVLAWPLAGAQTPNPKSTFEPTVTPVPRVEAGRIERWSGFESKHVAPRPIDIWLPEGFRPDGSHAVLYMHDGQMLFDPAITWNGQAWQVHTTAARLMRDQQLRPFIVVGIWNAGASRFAEYYPQGFLQHLPPGPGLQSLEQAGLGQHPRSDAYLQFLVEELRPAVEARLGAATGAANTFMAGASLGGMISVYGLCKYPQVFGGVAALSTHWLGSFSEGDDMPAPALAWLAQNLPPPGQHRLYIDMGSAELDPRRDTGHARVTALMRSLGFSPPLWDSRLVEGARHDEQSWAARLNVPLRHLFR
jgi:predicted alpha/beta superfamily hydrolase